MRVPAATWPAVRQLLLGRPPAGLAHQVQLTAHVPAHRVQPFDYGTQTQEPPQPSLRQHLRLPPPLQQPGDSHDRPGPGSARGEEEEDEEEQALLNAIEAARVRA